MNTQHTPGPWHVVHDTRGYAVAEGKDIYADEGGRFIVTDWAQRNRHHVQPLISETECAANARLIAEAGTVATETGLTPRQLAAQRADLLAALEQWIKEFDDNGWPKAPHADGCQCGPCLARAAIAKARGHFQEQE